MLDTADTFGKISSFSVECEFKGWDMWCRKYVLLGMQYFLEICRDSAFKERIIASMCRQADYIMSKIGSADEGKLPITSATNDWRGLNSSSILEPFVRLYSITKDKRYFDFAKYIVDCGGTDVANIFDLAYEDNFYPYQYPVTKAYEMMSCFEGLLEFYRITGNEKYKTAVINFTNKILESDFTVIGCCGCTGELFDHSTVRQANTTNDKVQQETCVTVTLMKLLWQLNLLTGDSRYADAFEISLYNAYWGALNTESEIVEHMLYPDLDKKYSECVSEPMPFDSYSPLTVGTRGILIGGFNSMSDRHYYGCCACIGSAGIGLVPKMQLLTTENGFSMNLFINGTVCSETPQGQAVCFDIKTEYPASGSVEVKLNLSKAEKFEFLIRNPDWSKETNIKVNGTEIKAAKGYVKLEREWQNGDIISISLDMRTEAVYPVSYGTDILMTRYISSNAYAIPTFDKEDPLAKDHIALRHGPLMLAQDSRLGYDPEEPISVKVDSNGYVATLPARASEYSNILAVNIPLTDGSYMKATDYSSAGKLWSGKSKIAVWMKTRSE